MKQGTPTVMPLTTMNMSSHTTCFLFAQTDCHIKKSLEMSGDGAVVMVCVMVCVKCGCRIKYWWDWGRDSP